ncbi:MAG TPA: glycoside hydrolase family 3 N-terminal domain-containing protein [Candidatus Binatia bacterium]|nr:glycoside hydrolase family 3 N-terminal domain-containing protein [Candidatus Binatia bacterium]
MTASRTDGRSGGVAARVEALLGRMNLDEKLAQLGSVWGFQVVRGGRIDRARLAALAPHGMGAISRLAGSTDLDIVGAARAANEIQRFLVEETRLGIPALIHEETLHGVLARGAPVFQQSIGAAATWDPELVEAVADTIRQRMRLFGARQALAPVLDVARDPRWGRIEETYGEDPYLAAVMGMAYVRGIQGPDLSEGLLATGKHLAGHGLAEGGLNQAPVHVGWRELRDEQLLPFEAAVRASRLGAVMPAYCEVDGLPCHASRALLTEILRDEWGFDGIVSSDYAGIEQLVDQHRLTPDLATAARLALMAGVDQELPRVVTYGEPLRRAVLEGRVSEDLVDRAVARILAAKIRLGLFEQPFVELPTPERLAELARVEAELGHRLAARSIVLLENDGTLPLPAPGATDGHRPRGPVAVVGPLADSFRDLLGDYSYELHIESLLDPRNGAITGLDAQAVLAKEPSFAGRRTVLAALRDALGADRVRYARGTGLREGADAELAEAVELARSAEVAVVVLGERSGLTDDATTGEFRDRRTLGFLGRQQELLEAVVATGTPVVLVVVSGRPLALEWAARHCAAVLLAWVPGDFGPDAIADVITGREAPGGKLPISMVRDVGQVPYHYRHHPSGGRSNPRGDHVDGPAGPLWPFGFGLTYTSFILSDFELDCPTLPTDGGQVGVRVRVRNVGQRTGDEVVQLYARDEEADVARPVTELCGFARLRLDPGEMAEVRFVLHAEQFAHCSVDYRRIVEPGRVSLSVGTSSAHRPLQASLELVGGVVEVPVRRHFATAVEIIRLGDSNGAADAGGQASGAGSEAVR